MQLVVADKPAEMWDVRYKYPQKRAYKQPDGTEKEYDTFTHHGAKVVAADAATAIALVKAHKPQAVILGVHHRAGGDHCRVLVDGALLSAMRFTPTERAAMDTAVAALQDAALNSGSFTPAEYVQERLDAVLALIERLG